MIKNEQKLDINHFDAKAKNWDKNAAKGERISLIAEAICNRFTLHKEMSVMDFGVGTGLLGFEIAAKVKEVYGVDTSKEMLEQVKLKNTQEISIVPVLQNLIDSPLERVFDAVISSMTLHHIEDLELFFTRIYENVKEDGFIAIADLECEDGTFHSDNSGVYHFGFEEEVLINAAQKSGFKDICFENINTIKKPHRDFGVFLLTAKK